MHHKDIMTINSGVLPVTLVLSFFQLSFITYVKINLAPCDANKAEM